MKSGAVRRALGLSILYIGLFALLVLLQFSRGPGLSVTVGGLSASASYPKTDRGKAGAAPDKVDISFAGLAFEISPSSKAESLAADGSATPLAPVSVERLPDGLRVKLSGGIELKATADKEERFSLAASAPNGVAGVRLRLLPSRTRFVQDDAKSKVVSGNGAAYDVALASGSLDGSAGLLLLKPGDAGLSLAKEAQSQPKAARAPSTGRSVTQAPKDPDAFKAEIGAWRDKAWAGLSQGRLDADKLVWKAADGSSSFSERALAAYIAEDLARGSYPDVLAKVKIAKEKWPDKLGALTAPYFGSLLLRMKVAETADQAEVKRLAQLLDAKSQAALEREGILRFVYERSPYPLLQELLALCSSQDPAKLTIRQDVGLLGCVVDARSLLKDEDDSIKDGGPAADRLVAATRQTADGCFLATEDDGSTDLRLSLLAGTCLVAYGNQASKPIYVGVGQSLVEGALGLSDAQGLMPARLAANDGSTQDKSGSLAPEDVYAWAAGNPYYPHDIAFARDIAPGLWAWTCSPSLTLQASPSRYVFLSDFPIGQSHFMAIYGIKPFVNIQLYDIDYSPDNNFEGYDASGFLYDKETGALYLKMRHKKQDEDIRLSF
jgi:hypothetical protein